jgi:hypothetical protein
MFGLSMGKRKLRLSAARHGRLLLGSALLLFQLSMIVLGHLTDHRYFCWAVFSKVASYRIEVRVNGGELSAAQVGQRYKISQAGDEVNSITNVVDILKQYETTYGANDRAQIRLLYTRWGAIGEQEWIWPVHE